MSRPSLFEVAILQSTDEDGFIYWSNDWGWGTRLGGTSFSPAELASHLPGNGDRQVRAVPVMWSLAPWLEALSETRPLPAGATHLDVRGARENTGDGQGLATDAGAIVLNDDEPEFFVVLANSEHVVAEFGHWHAAHQHAEQLAAEHRIDWRDHIPESMRWFRPGG